MISTAVARACRALGFLIMFLAMPLASGSAALASGPWEGSWYTNHGELRLIQTGDRVYGDYADRGMIEGRVSPDGGILRGAFNRLDGSWGLFQFELSGSGDAWEGKWSWNDDPALRDGVWEGRRSGYSPPALVLAVDAPFYWPIQMYEAPSPAFERFVSFADLGGGGTGTAIDGQLVGTWTLSNHEGTVGTLEIVRSEQALGEVFGTLRVWLSMGGTMAHEGEVGTREFRRDLLIVFIRSSEFDGEYALEIKLDGVETGTMQGALFGNGMIRSVYLDRTGGGTDSSDFEDEAMEGDLPGVGVSGPAYRLIGVPSGKRLAVRSAGNRDAETVDTLAADATEILVLGCEPYMEAYRYEELSDAGKRQVLDSSWCEIRHEAVRGFLPGRYLEAIVR